MITYTCDKCGVIQKGGEKFACVRKPVSGKWIELCPEHKELSDKNFAAWLEEAYQKMEDWLNQSTRSGE